MTVPGPAAVLELFARIADDVAAVLAANDDWGPSGRRDGQYAVDLDADAACTGPLLEAGLRTLSEESGVQGPDGAPTVVIDPLDGSTNASRHVPWFATALCLVDDDGPAAAMVANHATGGRTTALRGGGASHDGEPIRVSSCTAMSDAIVAFSALPTHHFGWSQFRVLGASAPDICLVASGVLDGWGDAGIGHGVWDYLASVLILHEAGGVSAELEDRELCVLDPTARRIPVVAGTDDLLVDLVDHLRHPR